MSKILIFSFLGCLCFLYTLNLFLRGAWKQIIEGVTVLLIVATVIKLVFLIGWPWGLLALLSPFILIGFFRSIAEKVAQQILGYRTGIDDESISVEQLCQAFVNGGEDYSQIIDKITRDVEKRRQRLSKLASESAISSVLQQHEISFEEYEKIFNSLWTSALHNESWEIVGTPTYLDSLIQMKKQGASKDEIWSHFRGIE